MRKIGVFYLVISFLIVISCSKKEDDTADIPATENKAKLIVNFSHYANGNPLVFNSMTYLNAALNNYEVTEVQYFISDLTFFKEGNATLTIKEWEDIYYVDTNIPNTLSWNVFDKISPAKYDSLGFTFGIKEAKNISFMYVNPPERDMFWPDVLGGGYHYLKLNGFWLNNENKRSPFNFHLGPGQIYTSENTTEIDSIQGFVDNSFMVYLKNSSINFEAGNTTTLNIRMNIEKWFVEPNIFDFNVHGGDIMQKQASMKVAAENGHNVFELIQ